MTGPGSKPSWIPWILIAAMLAMLCKGAQELREASEQTATVTGTVVHKAHVEEAIGGFLSGRRHERYDVLLETPEGPQMFDSVFLFSKVEVGQKVVLLVRNPSSFRPEVLSVQ